MADYPYAVVLLSSPLGMRALFASDENDEMDVLRRLDSGGVFAILFAIAEEDSSELAGGASLIYGNGADLSSFTVQELTPRKFIDETDEQPRAAFFPFDPENLSHLVLWSEYDPIAAQEFAEQEVTP